MQVSDSFYSFNSSLQTKLAAPRRVVVLRISKSIFSQRVQEKFYNSAVKFQFQNSSNLTTSRAQNTILKYP